MKYSIRTMLVVTAVLFLGLIAIHQNRRAAELETELLRYGIAKPLTASSPAAPADKSKMNSFGVTVELVELSGGQRDGSYSCGLRVNSVANDGAAFRAGIFEGDVIVAMGGWKIESADNLDFVVNAKKHGYRPTETYIVKRDGQYRQGSVEW